MEFIEKSYAALEFSDAEVQAVFDKVIKCKYIGKVLEVIDIEPPVDGCYSTLYIKLGTNSGEIILSQNGFSGNPCDGGDNLSIHYEKLPKIGEEIYGITDKETGFILRAGKSYFDRYPEIPLCEGLDVPQFSQNIVFMGMGILGFIILGIGLFWVKQSLKKSKHKK